mgnify:FL=1
MTKIRDHQYEYDRLAIGGTLPAFLFSYYNTIPLIYTELAKPFPFDRISALHSAFGETRLEAFDRLGFTASVAGLFPHAGTITTIRIIDENHLEAYSEARCVKMRFNELIIFDEAQIQNLPPLVKKVKKTYKVYDWMLAKKGKKHEHRLLETDDDFVKEVMFYPSFQRGANKTWFDPVAISYLTEDQLRDVNYGENLARLKVTSMMKEAGIRGPANGFDTRKPDRRLHYAVKIEHDKREVVAIGRDQYKDTDTIKFNHQPEEEIEKNTVDTHIKRVYNKVCLRMV